MNDQLNRIITHVDQLMAEKSQVLVAIEGKCTSGKSTLAAALAEHYDCNLFHMDDFFLRPQQRTPERFAEVGGNVDYERFAEEVLTPLMARKPFSYRPFDCSVFALAEPVAVIPKKLAIIEGTYSLHPYFGDPYDLKILLTVSDALQHQRVLERPAFLHARFFEQWIPMENRYFDQMPPQVHIVAE